MIYSDINDFNVEHANTVDDLIDVIIYRINADDVGRYKRLIRTMGNDLIIRNAKKMTKILSMK